MERKIKLFINQQFVISFIFLLFLALPSKLLADYSADYKRCLNNECGSKSGCDAYVDLLDRTNRDNILDVVTSSGEYSGEQIHCETYKQVEGSDLECKRYLGIKITIDTLSCGARRGSAGCTGQEHDLTHFEEVVSESVKSTCSVENRLGLASMGAVWHANSVTACNSSCAKEYKDFTGLGRPGCDLTECLDRTNAVPAVYKGFTEGLKGLKRCFGPGGKYEHSSIMGAIQSKLHNILSEKPLELKCPNDNTEKYCSPASGNKMGGHPGGNANSEQGVVNIFNSSIENDALYAHEFLHLVDGFDHDAVSHSGHNHPPGEGEEDPHNLPDETERGGTSNPHGLKNRHLDRVYACADLCFSPDIKNMTKEKCLICMNYPRESGRNSKCDGFMSNEDFAQMEKFWKEEKVAEAKIKKYCKEEFKSNNENYTNQLSRSDL